MRPSMTQKQFETHWAEIRKNFDWGRVEQVMWLLRWTWGGAQRPPTKKELQETAKRLLQAVAFSESRSCATGGFKATKYINEVGQTHLELEFILTSWETE